MNPPGVLEESARTSREVSLSKVSRLIRRIHMFTGLFLAPWMLMYALSTVVMTHRDWVSSFYSDKSPGMTMERELDYSRSFPAEMKREEIARQILKDLELDGTHEVRDGREGRPLVIHRRHALTPQRLTFNPSTKKILIEREEFRAPSFLERMHRRRGYNPYPVENVWGFIVDVAVVTMVFWALSGIWLWWELRSTRRWGALSLATGVSLFVAFVILI